VDVVVAAWVGDHGIKSLLQHEKIESPRGHPQLWWTGASTIAGGHSVRPYERLGKWILAGERPRNHSFLYDLRFV